MHTIESCYMRMREYHVGEKQLLAQFVSYVRALLTHVFGYTIRTSHFQTDFHSLVGSLRTGQTKKKGQTQTKPWIKNTVNIRCDCFALNAFSRVSFCDNNKNKTNKLYRNDQSTKNQQIISLESVGMRVSFVLSVNCVTQQNHSIDDIQFNWHTDCWVFRCYALLIYKNKFRRYK